MADPLALALAQGRDPYAPTVPMGPGGVPRANRYAPSDDASGADMRQRVRDWLPTTWPARMASAAWGGLTLPGDVAAGRVNPMSNEGIGRSAELAGLLTLGGAASAPARETGLGIFGGRLARTADHQALARAERMAAEGAPREAIWKDTGWFQGTDGKWRFEISDHASRIDANTAIAARLADREAAANLAQDASLIRHRANKLGATPEAAAEALSQQLNRPFSSAAIEMARSTDAPTLLARSRAFDQRFDPRAEPFRLSDVVDHPELLQAYPDLSDRPYNSGLGIEYGMGVHGAYDPAADAFDASRYYLATPETQRETGLHELQHAIQSREGFATGSSPIDFTDEARNEYLRSAGETEARNVSARMNMTAEERAATPPWLTQDVPTEQQIIRFGQDEPAASDELVRALMSPTSVARWGR